MAQKPMDKKVFDGIFGRFSGIRFVHYACGDMHRMGELKKMDALKDIVIATPVGAIGVYDREGGSSHVFSIHSTKEDMGDFAQKAERADLEYEMLNSFYSYVLQCPEDTLFMHWNMDSDTYGFEAIARRYTQLGGSPVPIPKEMRLNMREFIMAASAEGIYAILAELMTTNNLFKEEMLFGEAESKALEAEKYEAVHRSIAAKIDSIQRLFELFIEGKLVYDMWYM